MRLLALSLLFAMTAASAQAAETVLLHAAGSLKVAMSEVARAYEESRGGTVAVETAFGASGLLRERIEGGEAAQVYASANMKHPMTLAAAGKAGPVALFARNRLCALAQPNLDVTSDNLLATLLDPEVRVGTSTPKADPSGDYAWALFGRAEALEAGAEKRLQEKSLQLTGGPDSPKAPDGRNTYGWVMENDRADIFLTYCTNAVLAKKEVPDLKIVAIPEALSVGADYGVTVMEGSPAEAWRLALFILSPPAQEILASYGFTSGALPSE